MDAINRPLDIPLDVVFVDNSLVDSMPVITR